MKTSAGTLTRAEAIRRIRSALVASGHRNDRKEYVLWPPRESWPNEYDPGDGPVNAACDELGLYETPRAVLRERDRRDGNWIVEVYVSERLDPPGWRNPEWELCDNVEIDVEENEWTATGLDSWRPIPTEAER